MLINGKVEKLIMESLQVIRAIYRKKGKHFTFLLSFFILIYFFSHISSALAIPVAPTMLTPSGITSNSIQWNFADNSSDEDGFKLHDTAHTLEILAGVDSTSINESALLPNTLYTRHVHAYNIDGDSSASADASKYTLADPPTLPIASDGTYPDKINISWVASLSASTYRVYRDGISGVGTLVYNAAGNSFDDTITGAHNYYIYSVNGEDVENPSYITDSGSTMEVPSAPSIGIPSALSTTSIRWNFTDTASNEEGFKAHDSSHAITVSSDFPDLNFLDETGLLANTQYTRHVHAFNAAGDSAGSADASIYTLPNEPVSPSATAVSNSQIDMNWSAGAGGADHYHVMSSSDNYASLKHDGPSASFSETLLLANTQYTYRIWAVNADNTESANYLTISKYTLADPPSLPLATDGVYPDKINVSWTASISASHYHVYRDGISGAGTLVYDSIGTVFDDITTGGHTYYIYTVNGENVENPSYITDSGYTMTAPSAPTIGTPAALSASSIRWNFTDTASNEEGFKIHDSTDTVKASSASPDLTYLDEIGLSANTQYTRHVHAYNAAGDSVGSVDASIYTLPNEPVSPSATAASSSQIDLNWSAGAGGADHYHVRSSSDNYASIKYNEIATNFSEVGLSADTQYTYRIFAVNADGIESLNYASVYQTTPSENSILTSEGTNVNIDFSNNISLTFDEITNQGFSSALETSPPADLPSGFIPVGSNFNISTSATYNGKIKLTLPYDPANLIPGNEEDLKLFHWENGEWKDVTVLPVDTVQNRISGEVTSLSPFEVGQPGSEPTIGTPRALSPTSIRWYFTDNASNEQGFKLHDNSDQTMVSSDKPDLHNLDENGLLPNTQYTRHVHAYNAAGDSPPSANATIYTFAEPPTLPVATDGTYPDKINVSWVGSASANHYHVYRDGVSNSSSSTLTPVYDGGGTSFDDLTTGWHVYFIYSVNDENAENPLYIYNSGFTQGTPIAPGSNPPTYVENPVNTPPGENFDPNTPSQVDGPAVNLSGSSSWTYGDIADISAKTEGAYVPFDNQDKNLYDFDNSTRDLGPHAGYSTGTSKCEICHAVHRANGSFALTRSDSPNDVCGYCHVGDHRHSVVSVYWESANNIHTENGHTIGTSDEIPSSSVWQWTETKQMSSIYGEPQSILVRRYLPAKLKMFRVTLGNDDNLTRTGPDNLRCISCHQMLCQPQLISYSIWKPYRAPSSVDNDSKPADGIWTDGYKLLRNNPSGSIEVPPSEINKDGTLNIGDNTTLSYARANNTAVTNGGIKQLLAPDSTYTGQELKKGVYIGNSNDVIYNLAGHALKNIPAIVTLTGSPYINSVIGDINSDQLTVTFSEGVYANSDATGALEPADFVFTDTDNSRTITAVSHTPGSSTATLTLSSGLDDTGDFEVDSVSSADGNSIFNSGGQPVQNAPTIITMPGTPKINSVIGDINSDQLTVTFSEGVYANSDATGALEPADFVFTDTDNSRTITAVSHTPGSSTATLTLSSGLDDTSDIGVDLLAPKTDRGIGDPNQTGYTAFRYPGVTYQPNTDPKLDSPRIEEISQAFWCANCHNLSIAGKEKLDNKLRAGESGDLVLGDRGHASPLMVTSEPFKSTLGSQCFGCHNNDMARVAEAGTYNNYNNTGTNITFTSNDIACGSCHITPNMYRKYKQTYRTFEGIAGGNSLSDFPHSGSDAGYKLFNDVDMLHDNQPPDPEGLEYSSPFRPYGQNPDGQDKLCVSCHQPGYQYLP